MVRKVYDSQGRIQGGGGGRGPGGTFGGPPNFIKRKKRHAKGPRFSPGGGYSTQSWVSTVKLIEKAVLVNLHTEEAVTFP